MKTSELYPIVRAEEQSLLAGEMADKAPLDLARKQRKNDTVSYLPNFGRACFCCQSNSISPTRAAVYMSKTWYWLLFILQCIAKHSLSSPVTTAIFVCGDRSRIGAKWFSEYN